MSQTFGNIALGLMFLLLTLGIGLLPVFFGLDGLYMCSIGSIIFGVYAFILPSRIAYRLVPKVVKGSTDACCIRELFRAWGMFAVGLGAMGQAICRFETENKIDGEGSSTLYRHANCIYLAVVIVSITWDLHLMKSKHWESSTFLIFNIFVNISIIIASLTGILGK